MSRSFWQILEDTVRADILKEMKVQAELRAESYKQETPFRQTHFESELFSTQKAYRLRKSGRYSEYARQTKNEKETLAEVKSRDNSIDPDHQIIKPLNTEQWLALRLLNQHGAHLNWPCTPKQLARAWKKLAFHNHPDRQTSQLSLNLRMTSETFLLLKNAVDVLRLALKQKS